MDPLMTTSFGERPRPARAAGAVRVSTQMSRLPSPMNREKRCEKQRFFIRTPSLSVWPNGGQMGGEKNTFHTRRATNKRYMGQPPLTGAFHTPCRRTGQTMKHQKLCPIIIYYLSSLSKHLLMGYPGNVDRRAGNRYHNRD